MYFTCYVITSKRVGEREGERMVGEREEEEEEEGERNEEGGAENERKLKTESK